MRGLKKVTGNEIYFLVKTMYLISKDLSSINNTAYNKAMIAKQTSLPLSFMFFSAFLICVFIALGTWQLKRKEEKEAFLHSLATVWEGQTYNVDEVKDPPMM